MCLIWQKENIPQDTRPLPFEVIKYFIKSLAELTDKKMIIDFVGGEPLMRSDISALIKTASSYGLMTTLCTNGYLLDMDMAKLLLDCGLNRLSISLDSLNEHSHDAIRGKAGSYKRIMNAMGCLSKFTSFNSEDFKVNVQTIIVQDNLKELVRLADWVQNNAVLCSINYMAVLQPLHIRCDGHNWYSQAAYRELWPQNTAEVCAVIDELIRLKTQGGYSKIANSVAQLKAFKLYFENPERFIKKNNCGLGDYALNINYNGDATFCYELGNIGNIYEDDIKQMWYSQRANQLRERMKQCTKNCNFLINCFKAGIGDEFELAV